MCCCGNLVMLFVFWEIIGFTSYLLIGFWTHKPLAGHANTKAFIINRISDIFLFAGIIMIWVETGSPAYHILLQGDFLSTSSSMLILLGCIGKSAQFPLHIWLPNAMQGPTPVSSLIHAATLVAAGIYLLMRLFPILPDFTLHAVTVLGAFTSFF